MILNLAELKESYTELYNNLLNYDCKVSYNGKTLFEGKYDENFNYGKKNKSCIVVEFKLGDSNAIFTLERNSNIETLKTLFEGKDILSIFTDAQLYNKAMMIANNLPLFGITNESNTDNNILSIIKKHGTNWQKVYENLNM